MPKRTYCAVRWGDLAARPRAATSAAARPRARPNQGDVPMLQQTTGEPDAPAPLDRLGEHTAEDFERSGPGVPRRVHVVRGPGVVEEGVAGPRIDMRLIELVVRLHGLFNL